jgi:hypothetical protein
MTLTEFLAARLDEDARSALAASSEWDRQAAEPEHWRWECSEDDTPLDVNLAIASNAEFLDHGEHFRVGLRSLESYPSTSVPEMRPLVHLVISDEEVSPQVARHIARHDPARVLREVEAGRRLVMALIAAERYRAGADSLGNLAGSYAAGEHAGLMRAAEFRAAVYDDHPDYDEAWRP